MRIFAFALPDSLDEKDLSMCLFNANIGSNKGDVSYIDDSGKFIRETVKVCELSKILFNSHENHTL